MDITELKDLLRQSGVVGAGGAGFPTYAKLDQRAETIIMNCAECEPLLKLHRQLLEQEARAIVRAFHLIGETVGAGRRIIGIKRSYRRTGEALLAVLDEFPDIELGFLDEVYPTGDEVVLIYEVTGRVVPPGGIPIDMGVAVFNVETVYNVARAVRGHEPVTEKLVTVVGEVSHPVTVRLPIGCSIDEAVARAGAITTPDPVYFLGGPMMGRIVPGTEVVTKTCNAVLVLPRNHQIIMKKKKQPSIDLKRAAASCCQCSMCTDLCPRHLLGHPIEPHKFMQAATCKDIQNTEIYLNTMFCSSCGLCEMFSCMQSLSPRTLIAEYKDGLKKAGVPVPKGISPAPVSPARGYRKVPEERLLNRLGLARYDVPAPMTDGVFTPSKVRIPMSQHIGAPAVPAVAEGDSVTAGQMIGRPAEGLSTAIHASIDGKVVEVNKKYVIIKQNEQKGRARNE